MTRRLSSVQHALLAQKLRSSAPGFDPRTSEPIAIVGMGCRFPGGASDPERFWQRLAQGFDAVSEVPADRWDVEACDDPDRAAEGKTTSRWGAFLEDVYAFDPGFFGISPREALHMDPQQRLLLEVVWEALEDSGQTPERLAGSATGVYVAIYNNDYAWVQSSRPERIDAYTSSGTSHSIAANRISYWLDLRGPSLAVDTACSSSLVAVHLACRDLRQGLCERAIVGAVSLMLTPEMTVSLSRWGMMAPDGRCKTFDARADGFVRGEGCGVVVLERLADALASGDPILAVIRGTAINQDGCTNGLTAPNGLSQQALLRECLADAGLGPEDLTYLEAHGTGTSLGDPIEMEAVAAVLGELEAGPPPCAVGSVKTNIGHLEAAAGMAGLIKVVLSLRKEAIPPHLHFTELNPRIRLEGSRFVIPRELVPWPGGETPRCAGVSSFGFGGTNAHVIVEEAPRVAIRARTDEERETSSPALLVFSGRTREALRDLARRYAEFLEPGGEGESIPLADLCHTAGLRRAHHEHRLAVVGRSHREIADRIAAYVQGRRPRGLLSGAAAADVATGPVFVFSGQGPQWWGMGRELLARDAAFRAVLEDCDAIVRRQAGWSLLEEMTADEPRSRIDRTEIAQPAILALQTGLVAIWRSRGIEPAAIVGHSVGEIAAAHCAGALSLEEAMRVALERGRLMERAAGRGTMVAVDLGPGEIAPLLDGLETAVAIAAINAPDATVLSGETAAIEAVARLLQDRGAAVASLGVRYAFHSPQIEEFRSELVRALDAIAPRAASVPMISTVTARRLAGLELDGGYWARNMREPVLFAAAIETLLDEGHRTFIEIAPHPVLSSHILRRQAPDGGPLLAVPSLRRGRDESASLLEALAALYVRGQSVRWESLHPDGAVVRLPSYAWQRSSFRLAAAAASPEAHGGGGGRPLLGARVSSPVLRDVVFESRLDGGSPSFLADHRVHGAVVVPATAYVEMALAAAGELRPGGSFCVEDLVIREALALPERGALAVQTVLTREGSADTFRIYARDASSPIDSDWKLHVEGKVRVSESDRSDSAPIDLDDARRRCGEEVDVSSFYARYARSGVAFGASFRAVREIWRGSREAIGRVELPGGSADEYRLHPVLLDACFHLLGAAVAATRGTDEEDAVCPYVPWGLERVALRKPGASRAWASLRLTSAAGDDALSAEGYLAHENGEEIARFVGLELRRATSGAIRGGAETKGGRDLYRLDWDAAALAHGQDAAGEGLRWLILTGSDPMARRLAERLEERGGRCVVARAGDPDGLARILAESFAGIVHAGSLTEMEGATSLSRPVLEARCAEVAGLVRALAERFPERAPRLWLVTRGAQRLGNERADLALEQASLWGLGATVGLEHPELRCTLVDLDPDREDEEEELRALVDELLGASAEDRIALRKGARYVARLVPRGASRRPENAAAERVDLPPGPSYALDVSRPGTIDGLRLRSAKRRPPGPNEVEIRVRASALNFRDLLNVLALDPTIAGPVGVECAGTVAALGEGVTKFQIGDPVVAALAPGSFSLYVTTTVDRVLPKPERLSFEEAAAIPIAYMTAEVALGALGRLSAGESVLIHAGAGGVGLAAIELALRKGAQVYATAGSPAKRRLLEARGVRRAMSSRTLDFSEEVLIATGGRGIDVAVNALTGDFVAKTLSVLAPGGRFVELGKRDVWTADRVAAARSDVSYHHFDLADLPREDPARFRDLFSGLLSSAAQGDLRPLPCRAFPVEEVVSAFRFMAQSRHVGKIVLTHPPGPEAQLVRADATYLITGGLGGIGRRVAEWLRGKGARSVVLMGRSGDDRLSEEEKADLAGKGIAVARGDVSKEEDVRQVLERIRRTMPPLRGIFHAAGVTDDGVLVEQTEARFSRVMAPKLGGTWNFHALTREDPLELFVLFSSAASVLGSAGQGNYAAANAFLDAFAEYRRSRGWPAASVNWGAWSEAGMAARRRAADERRAEAKGLGALDPEEACRILELVLREGDARVLAARIDAARFLRAMGGDPPPFYSRLAAGRARDGGEPPAGEESRDLRAVWETMRAGEIRRAIESHVTETVARVLGLPVSSSLNPKKPLMEMGLDSLMAVELRNALGKSVGKTLPTTLIFRCPTIEAIAALVEQEVSGGARKPAAPSDEAPGSAADDLAALSDDQVKDLLASELGSLSADLLREN